MPDRTITHPSPLLPKFRWFVWAGGQKMPRTSTMRGTWGYDAECVCGWQTRTGGATRAYVDQQVWAHRHGWDI